MRKRKIKRYAGEGESLVDSGEEKLKQKGLEESKNERVGFLERLRMGNIDKPGSEAYEKFGAGRGRAAVASKENRPTSIGTEDYATLGKRAGATSTWSGAPSIKEETPQDMYEPDSVAGEGAKNLAAPIKEKRKNKIVSKKQLEESGLSLRDYLNKERGLTRKGMASGGKVSSASSRADGIAQRGKTKGRIC